MCRLKKGEREERWEEEREEGEEEEFVESNLLLSPKIERRKKEWPRIWNGFLGWEEREILTLMNDDDSILKGLFL